MFYAECNTLPLNGSLPILQGNYDQCIGHLRLYCCVHGEAFDVSSLLGPKKVIYSTAKAGSLFIRVTLEDEDGSHEFSLVVDGREGWNYDWINKHGYLSTTIPLQTHMSLMEQLHMLILNRATLKKDYVLTGMDLPFSVRKLFGLRARFCRTTGGSYQHLLRSDLHVLSLSLIF